jgi:signal recognition particle receptor subunit beta
MAQEYIVLVAGPMGAGKTTAISALSEIPLIKTEALNTDLARNAKALTTVALDYGEITIGEGDKVRLYGVPGQERFDFMWKILERRALGLLLLLDNTAPDPLADMNRFIKVFADLDQRGALVIGVTRHDLSPHPTSDDFHRALAAQDRVVPIFTLDARQPAQVRVLLGTLIAMVEARASAASGTSTQLHGAIA